MSNVAKIAVPLLLVAAVGGAAAFYFASDAGPSPIPVVERKQEQPRETAPVQPAAPQQAENPAPQQPVRVEFDRSANVDAPQGVRGRVLLPDGQPAAGVEVVLTASDDSDPINIFLKRKLGEVTAPVAVGTTDADGTFALGLTRVDKAVDLRIVTPDHPQLSRRQLTVKPKQWYDLRDLTLDQGLVVQGRVIDLASKLPLANATVYLASASQTHLMLAIPGQQEEGTPAVTDGAGWFQFSNAPRQGLVHVTASAPGYATARLLNQPLRADAPTEFTLELDQGMPLAGVVCDQNGRPIAGAKVTANGLSAKTPQTASTESMADGRFEFPTLRHGPYELLANAAQYSEVRLPLAVTGEEDVKIVLITRGTVRLKVIGADQRPVKAYGVSLKRFFPNNPLGIGHVLDFPDRNVTPADYDGEWAVLRGVPSGSFRLQLTERNHAKSLSPDFTVVEGGEPVEVVAQLTLGASIQGTVIDDQNRPVANAVVTTDLNAGVAADSGIFKIFKNMIPEKHTVTKTTTDAQGRFRINKLAFADYMLRIAHPDFCEGTAIGINLEREGQMVDVGVVQLNRGAIVEGVVTLDGVPAGQVKVVVSMPMTAENVPQPGPDGTQQPPRNAQVIFNAEVHTDADGRFRLLKRVPPGTYKATAARHSQDNPFMALMDMRATELELQVQPGRDQITLEFRLPSR